MDPFNGGCLTCNRDSETGCYANWKKSVQNAYFPGLESNAIKLKGNVFGPC